MLELRGLALLLLQVALELCGLTILLEFMLELQGPGAFLYEPADRARGRNT
jgi:hypothetical protein